MQTGQVSSTPQKRTVPSGAEPFRKAGQATNFWATANAAAKAESLCLLWGCPHNKDFQPCLYTFIMYPSYACAFFLVFHFGVVFQDPVCGVHQRDNEHNV